MAKDKAHLEKGLSLTQATAINMIDMVGIGPFVTTSMIVGLMNGPMSLFAWVLGALLAYTDGMVWAELGSKWPGAGGSYVFLRKLYDPYKLGALMSFLFIWQTTFQAPLVIASGAIGFAKYFSFLVPLTIVGKKLVSAGLIVLLVFLLYRKINSVGKISVVLWIVTGATILWLIFSGMGSFHPSWVTDWHMERFDTKWVFFAALGQATLKSVYSYLGYYNVCHLGDEIKNPTINIPKCIMISITGIAVLYLSMQIMILGVLPWEQIKGSDFVASLYFETIYHSHLIGQIATCLILVIAGASLFSAILGYSRIPYAAAVKGDFFPIFARLHPKHKFPHFSLLLISTIGLLLSVTMDLGETIAVILIIRIPVQFISQALGLILWRYKNKGTPQVYKMILFPIPAIVSILLWIYIFTTKNYLYMVIALAIILSGIAAFYIKEQLVPKKELPQDVN